MSQRNPEFAYHESPELVQARERYGALANSRPVASVPAEVGEREQILAGMQLLHSLGQASAEQLAAAQASLDAVKSAAVTPERHAALVAAARRHVQQLTDEATAAARVELRREFRGLAIQISEHLAALAELFAQWRALRAAALTTWDTSWPFELRELLLPTSDGVNPSAAARWLDKARQANLID